MAVSGVVRLLKRNSHIGVTLIQVEFLAIIVRKRTGDILDSLQSRRIYYGFLSHIEHPLDFHLGILVTVAGCSVASRCTERTVTNNEVGHIITPFL